ncbi:MAG: TIGR02300 family protein [Hyphomicrobiaceae bacterium]|nr:TIGR02300 family protein [Hyphomicrobiaceae bacterium]
MAKAELGTKRLCPSCGTKYYDLNRSPIVCPKCATVFTLSAVIARAKASPVHDEEDTDAEEGPTPVDFVSLEEADAEVAGEADVPDLEDADIADVGGDDDDTFLEEEEEDDAIDGIDIEVEADEEER